MFSFDPPLTRMEKRIIVTFLPAAIVLTALAGYGYGKVILGLLP